MHYGVLLKMKISFRLLIVVSALTALHSCNTKVDGAGNQSSENHSSYLVEQSNPIVSVIFESFNWETGVTEILSISKDQIKISSKMEKDGKILRGSEYLLSQKESQCITDSLKDIETVETGHHFIEGLADGSSDRFVFTFENGDSLETTLNNVNFTSYDSLVDTAFKLVKSRLEN